MLHVNTKDNENGRRRRDRPLGLSNRKGTNLKVCPYSVVFGGDFQVKHFVFIIFCFMSLIFLSGGVILAEELKSADEGMHGYIKDENGSPLQDVDVSLFDGFSLHNVKTDNNGEYKISKLPVSINYYLILFITKNDYIPRAVNLKNEEKGIIEYSASLIRSEKENTGYIIGAMFQPARGGKIKFQNGIKGFSKKKAVWLEKDHEVINSETDMDGHFLFGIEPGRYKLHSERGKDISEIDVLSGQTIIRNIRTGIVLID
ncbi:MAG: hypothetical protein A3D21_08465 [Nitrospirae bacterium RIFCSPHIGHO2_02_FULL_42_12]|nr:MAG: hypothetical protein A3D21_08465 [Nitrospirae bacterium RIFCSPHIGHO2_02_FULL_42_12]